MEIVEGYRPGAIGAIAGLHGTYYAREWGFGRFFESKVATELCAFLDRHDPATDRLWLVVDGQGATVGSMVIDGGGPDVAAKGAHLRWFILGDGCRGGGWGQRLMDLAMAFCDAQGHHRVYLTTFAGLDAARALYERHGFRLVEEGEDTTWGVKVTEQLFERP